MNKKSIKRFIPIFIIAIQSIIIIFMWTFISSDDGTNNWFCEESPDNKYSISANVIEQPFLNGSTNVAIYIATKRKLIHFVLLAI